MPMPSKGVRKPVFARVPQEIHDALEARRIQAGATSLSQYVADLLAVHAGRQDLVRELNQEVVRLTA